MTALAVPARTGHGGGIVGFVEQTRDGHYVGFDGRATPVGHYDSLPEARRAVEDARIERRTLSPRVEHAMQVTAAVTGVVATGVLGTALLTLVLL